MKIKKEKYISYLKSYLKKKRKRDMTVHVRTALKIISEIKRSPYDVSAWSLYNYISLRYLYDGPKRNINSNQWNRNDTISSFIYIDDKGIEEYILEYGLGLNITVKRILKF